MERLKILITTDWYEPVINGVVTSVVTLKEQLERLGCEVRILTLSENGQEGREGAVYYLSSVDASRIYPGARAAFPSGRCLEELRPWKPDVIHSQCEFSRFLAAKRVAGKAGIPIVHTYHTVYEDYTHYFSAGKPWGRRAGALFSRLVLKRTDRVIVPTGKVERLLAGYGVDRPIEVIPTGIRTERFAPGKKGDPDRMRIRGSLGIGPERIVLLALGRLAKEKNLEELIACFGMLDEGTELVIAGDGPERERLMELAGRQKGRERIHFPGMIPFEETPAWYHAADLFVCASQSETQGITYLEALSAGLPVVCRRDECVEGIVRSGYNGYVYETAEEFAAFCRLLAGEEDTPTLIFDEIDTGISGVTAGKVGEKLRLISKNRQIICITHLPQIAAVSDSHYLIQKETDGNSVKTEIAFLDDEMSVQELARMLGGANVTGNILESA